MVTRVGRRMVGLALWAALMLAGPALALPDGATEAAPGALAEAEELVDFRPLVERAWFETDADLAQRARRAQKVAAPFGGADAEAASRALLSPDRQPIEAAELALATELAPNLPLAHMSVALHHWAEAERGAAFAALADAVLAVPRHLEASAFLASSALVILSVTLVSAAIALIVGVGIARLGRAAHDLGDLVSSASPAFARAALLGSFLLLPWIFGEGVMGVLVLLFAIGVIYEGARYRMALMLSAVLLVLGLEPVANMAGRALATLGSDPVAESAWAVTRDMGRPADLARLEAASADDTLAANVLAIEARRHGRDAEALERYTNLLTREPRNPVVLTNLANLHFAAGDLDRAISLYEVASLVTESAVVFFDLSQAYARVFRMDEFERALQQAQSLDHELVARLSRREDPGFTADLPLGIAAIRARVLRAADGRAFAAELLRPLAPGILGQGWQMLAGVFGGVFALALIIASRVDVAGACGRCGRRICGRCDGTVWSEDTCEACHRLFTQPEGVDPAIRSRRVEEVYAREARIRRIALVGSLVVPGAAGLLVRRPDLSLVGLLAFSWAAAAVAWREGVVPDPLALGALGPFILLSTAALAVGAYLVVLTLALLARRRTHT